MDGFSCCPYLYCSRYCKPNKLVRKNAKKTLPLSFPDYRFSTSLIRLDISYLFSSSFNFSISIRSFRSSIPQSISISLLIVASFSLKYTISRFVFNAFSGLLPIPRYSFQKPFSSFSFFAAPSQSSIFIWLMLQFVSMVLLNSEQTRSGLPSFQVVWESTFITMHRCV